MGLGAGPSGGGGTGKDLVSDSLVFLIEMRFTEHDINHVQVNNSVAFNTFT